MLYLRWSSVKISIPIFAVDWCFHQRRMVKYFFCLNYKLQYFYAISPCSKRLLISSIHHNRIHTKSAIVLINLTPALTILVTTCINMSTAQANNVTAAINMSTALINKVTDDINISTALTNI